MVKTESSFRRYAYGAAMLLGETVCAIPSHHLRRWLLTGLFGLKMGANSVMYRRCRLRAPWKIQIGSGSAIGGAAELDGRGKIDIGENVNISSEVMIWTAQHDHRTPNLEAVVRMVIVENFVWIGPRVIVLPGVTIKEGCVIAAGAVVTKSTEPFGIYAGVPAQRIGERRRDLSYVPATGYTPFV